MEVHIIRHTTLAIESGVCYGQSDVDVSDNFLNEAEHYNLILDDSYDAVFSSPLQRCQKLGRQLDRGELIIDSRLMELNFGAWELKKWNEINRSELDLWTKDIVDYKAENGESLSDFYQRTVCFLKELSEKKMDKVLIITHSGFVRCVWKYILDFPLKNLMKLPVDYGEVLKVKLDSNSDYQWIVKK